MPDCGKKTKAGDQCWLSIGDARPAQYAVGYRAVDEKREKFRGMSGDEFKKYLKKHPAPVMRGPKGNFYLLDHHHLARAAWSVKGKAIVAELRDDWSSLGEAAFWNKMVESGFAYLYDEDGRAIAPSRLPKTVADLKDDPYRSLAGEVRDRGGYDKSGAFFAEFQWAAFFRSRIAKDTVKRDFERAVKKAIELARSPEARKLPGYHG